MAVPLSLSPPSSSPPSGSPPAAQTVDTVCGYCGVGCGLRLEITDGAVVKATGNPDHPVNRGRLCTKGATTAELLAAGGRLTTASLRHRRDAAAGADDGPRRDH